MKDRNVQFPHRYQLVPVAGQEGVFDFVPVPGTITEMGTPINKANLLSDATAEFYGLAGNDATVNKALAAGSVKVGEVRTFGHEVSDPIWIPCNSQWVEKATYPELDEVIDHKWEKDLPLDIIQRDSKIASYRIYSAAYGNGVFVVAGASGKISTSNDNGVTWESRNSGFGSSYVYEVAYGNGLFVAVGQAGKISTSPDGITWTSISNGNTRDIYSITFANNMFYAVGDNRTFTTSSDGITWTTVYLGVGAIPTSQSFIRYINGRLYVGDSGSYLYIFISDNNGLNWDRITMPVETQYWDICEKNGVYVLLSSADLFLSYDNGNTWIQANTGITGWRSVAYGKGMWVFLVTSGVSSAVRRSFDLQTFPSSGTFNSSTSIAYHGGVFLFGASNGNVYTIERPENKFVVPSYNQDMPFTYIKGAR